MKVFRVKLDVNRFQSLHFQNEDAIPLDDLIFDGSPRADKWKSPRMFVLQPNLSRGAFFKIWATTTFAVGSQSLDTLEDLLEMSGELLPIICDGEQFYAVNVLTCFDCLDKEQSEWGYRSTGVRTRIKRFAFHPNRLPEVPLFKIPETNRVDILTVEGMKCPEDEFKCRVEKEGLTGLVFEELWSSD